MVGLFIVVVDIFSIHIHTRTHTLKRSTQKFSLFQFARLEICVYISSFLLYVSGVSLFFQLLRCLCFTVCCFRCCFCVCLSTLYTAGVLTTTTTTAAMAMAAAVTAAVAAVTMKAAGRDPFNIHTNELRERTAKKAMAAEPAEEKELKSLYDFFCCFFPCWSRAQNKK